MIRTFALLSLACLFVFGTAGDLRGAVLTFNDLIIGQVSYGFDADGDGVDDVLFTTLDPQGFNTFGPGVNQNFINEPGLEGTSLLNPDLRVDFLKSAVTSIAFSFALNSFSESEEFFASLQLFDSQGAELGFGSLLGEFTTTPQGTSDYPEGRLTVDFAGVAAYGLFNFESEFGRYIIDDVEGTFGSLERVPEPGTMALAALGVFAVLARVRRSAGRRPVNE
ncbi:MAG: PEP-CTERM sorting domain-containing protein [Bryobacteraceae bacterium]|nr:PEP-CTERM sorting domain-containing protein [Bryobacteraceae bacterium]